MPSTTCLSTPSRSNRRPAAFTLIELLVVIAIIAILAAILFPVFAQAREKARQTACISNQKQIGTAILQYNQDYDDAYPMGFYGTSASQTPLSWPIIIQPYLKNMQILMCPSDSNTPGPIPGTFTASTPAGVSVNYMLNFRLSGNGAGTAFAEMPTIVAPATTVMLTDGGANPQSSVGQTTTNPDTWVPYVGGAPAGTNTLVKNDHGPWIILFANSTSLPDATYVNYGAPLARHNKVCNVLWADGHTKASKIQSFYTTYNTPVAGKANGWSSCLAIETGCE